MEPLKKNTRPLKEFKMFGWYFATKTAEDIWAKDVGDTRETYFIKFCKLEHDGSVAYNLIIGKISLFWSKLDA